MRAIVLVLGNILIKKIIFNNNNNNNALILSFERYCV